MAGYALSEMNLGMDAGVARIQVAETTANFLATLGVEPSLGRAFAVSEDVKGGGLTAVIGYGLWQRIFAAIRRRLGPRSV